MKKKTFIPDFPVGHEFYGRDFPPEEDFEIRPSKIAGFGVFALKDFKGGDFLMDYGGLKVRRESLSTDLKKSIYIFDVGGGFVRDPSQGEHTMAIIINNFCTPYNNCISVLDGDKIFFQATRRIKAGDELGYDYLIDFNSPLTQEKWEWGACKCGTPNCRRSMFGLEQMKNLAFDIGDLDGKRTQD